MKASWDKLHKVIQQNTPTAKDFHAVVVHAYFQFTQPPEGDIVY